MDEAAKKTTLRMIPYGLFVATTKDGDKVNGADIVRVHDVAQMAQVARMTDAICRPTR